MRSLPKQRQQRNRTRLDQPWHRPRALWYALCRLPGLLHPPMHVYDPPTDTLSVLHDLPVVVRDGTTLRVNVVVPAGAGRCPVLLSAHPYGKDNLPARRGRGHRVSVQYRLLRQTGRVRFSSLTGWEAPDPAWWTAHGYAVVNADLRGAGTSEGTASLLSDQEGEDVYDLIEWAAAQPWSSGAVGLLGVSYLAITQWKAAALQPPSLKAICPWEGFTDAYRDLLRPGGIREDGFSRLWSRSLRQVRQRDSLIEHQQRHPLRDAWWRGLVPALDKITVPALVCASFSDNNLHSRGSFRGWDGISSAERFLYTHRGGKWATFYSSDARAAQLRFFDRYLRGHAVPAPPRVRLEVRASRNVITSVREEESWPLARTDWRPLYLTAAGLATTPPAAAGQITFTMRSQGACWDWTLTTDTEITGPMALRLWAEAHEADDMDLFVGVEKWRGATYIPFEGSYGFGVTASPPAGSKPRCGPSTNSARGPSTPSPPSASVSRWRRDRSFQWTSPWARRPLSSGQGRPCGWSSRDAGCGHATRSPDNSRPPTRRAPTAAVPCTGTRSARPTCSCPSFPCLSGREGALAGRARCTVRIPIVTNEASRDRAVSARASFRRA